MGCKIALYSPLIGLLFFNIANSGYRLGTVNSFVSKVFLQIKWKFGAGPGLAQLAERLAHRYSESTSLNPGNLTSATVCGDRTGCTLATKRSASVAPEVDLRECTLHSPLQKVNKAEPTLALNPEVTSPEIQNRGTSGPKKGHVCPPKTFFFKVEISIPCNLNLTHNFELGPTLD